jgi:hypothetical protein
MSEPEWRIRSARPGDRGLLASFACADPAVSWQVDVEQFIRTQLAGWAFDPHATAGDPRLLLAFVDRRPVRGSCPRARHPPGRRQHPDQRHQAGSPRYRDPLARPPLPHRRTGQRHHDVRRDDRRLRTGTAARQHPDAITAGSRGEERVASGQQRLALVCIGTQHEQRDGLAGRALPCHEQAERPPADAERVRRRSRSG